ncbi:MAG: FtsX-like permease family protein [bacterium]
MKSFPTSRPRPASISAANAEEALFGGGDELESVTEAKAVPPADVVINRDKNMVAQMDTYSPEALHQGVVLNAAVLLKDPSKLPEFMSAISANKDLGVQALNWQDASGLVGQFILVIRLVLYTAIFIIFLVALVIINNSMVMATMERIPEIGTMRAIGAQKSTIMLMTLLETTALCAIAGTIGAGLGAGLIAWLGHVGIKAPNDVMVFLFGGPALHPTFGAGNLFFGAFIILIVSLISTLYPAIVATRVQPVVAMRGKD